MVAAGESVSYLAREGEGALGLIAYRDEIRPTAGHAVARLKKMGIRVLMLSGDAASSAAYVARQVGIDEVRAELTPERKLQIIRDLRARGEKVAMVGDGINDALALTEANVGIALAAGAGVAMNSAQITLMGSDPAAVAEAIDLSRRTYGKIKQNLWWAFGYNVVALPLAATGTLGPMMAGGFMAFSSFGVVMNALSLKLRRPAVAPPAADAP